MTKLSIFRAPKVRVNAGSGGFWKQILMTFIGTTISLVLTVGTARMLELRQRVKDRRLSAMMVMSNIESFAKIMETRSERLARNDTVATWLLAQPVSALEKMPPDELQKMLNTALDLQFLAHDKSAENIFSENIDTWKNMGSFDFIDLVGSCFSVMNTSEEYWNGWLTEVNNLIKVVSSHPDDYEGNSTAAKLLNNLEMRNNLERIHKWCGWMRYVSASMHYYNRKNMAAIGITEEELWEFIEKNTGKTTIEEAPPNAQQFNTPPLNPTKLTTMREATQHLANLVSEEVVE